MKKAIWFLSEPGIPGPIYGSACLSDPGAFVTYLGHDGGGLWKGGNRREPDGATVVECEETKVESSLVTSWAGEDVNN